MFTKVSHITIFVADQSEALGFYRKLGFKVHTDAQFGDMRWLTLCLPQQPDLEVVLMVPDEEHAGLIGRQNGIVPLLSLETDDCCGDYQRLVAEGVVGVQEPKDEPWGISAAIKDLSGNLIYICQQK